MRPRAASILVCVAALGAAARAGAADIEAPAWRWDAVLKIDALRADPPETTSALGLFDLRLTVDAERLLGWPRTVLRIEGLATEGGKPNRRVGTLQGISNLEVARNAVRLYATSIERSFGADGSVLFGLYDLNSEFYSTEASALLVHPAFGIGAELGQTGANGPSIFPNLGLALRVRTGVGGGFSWQSAAIDAVPGDPRDPARTWVHLSSREGALLVAEGGWRDARTEAAAPARWAVGIWSYTRPAPRLEPPGARRNAGAYALVQQPLFSLPHARATGFMRAGVANAALNPIAGALDAGVLVENPFGTAGPSALTFGVASAAIGSAGRRAIAARGERPSRHETTIEAGVRWKARSGLAWQPLVQHMQAAGGRSRHDVRIIGVRIEWSPRSGAP